MASTINASTSLGLQQTADTSGVLQLQTVNTTAVTIDASQNVGVGVTPSAWSSAFGPVIQTKTGTGAGALTGSSVDNYRMFANTYYDGAYKRVGAGYATQYEQAAGTHVWYTAGTSTANSSISFTQAMTLDSSGNLLVGTTALASSTTGFVTNAISTGFGSVGVCHSTAATSGTAFQNFYYNASVIGSISQNGTTGVLYNLTSDYRLKNDQQPLTGAKEFVMALQPKKWQWWDGSGEGVGFIAHEFMEVAKYSGHGEKDAVDENGNIIPQSIQPSSSEVMANLVAFIQEQQAIITTLTERITALENK